MVLIAKPTILAMIIKKRPFYDVLFKDFVVVFLVKLHLVNNLAVGRSLKIQVLHISDLIGIYSYHASKADPLFVLEVAISHRAFNRCLRHVEKVPRSNLTRFQNLEHSLAVVTSIVHGSVIHKMHSKYDPEIERLSRRLELRMVVL